MVIYTIYKITNLVNGKIYIGQTSKTAEQRFVKHKLNAKNGLDTYLYRAIRKHGEDHFVIESIFITFDMDAADFYEKHFIRECKSYVIDNPTIGYNMTRGGDGIDSETGSIIQKARFQSGNHNWAQPEWSEVNRQNNLKRVAEGRHHFAGAVGSQFQKDRVAAGLHPWAGKHGSEHNRQKSRKAISEGTHNFGSEFSSYHNKQRVENGTHNFMGEEASKLASKRSKTRMENGTHHFLKLNSEKIECPHCRLHFTKPAYGRYHGEKCKMKTV
jgi:group I intron endonuclease